MDRLTREQLDVIEARHTAGGDAPEDVGDLLTELRLLQRDLKDSRKENAYLLKRVSGARALLEPLSIVVEISDWFRETINAWLNEVPK